MVAYEQMIPYIQFLLFPIVVLGLWALLFNSKNTFFTKFFIEGGYLIFIIPLTVLTFLTVPMILVLFWASATGKNEVSWALLGILVGISLIIEYFYIKRMIKQIEEKEQMPILDILRRELKRDTHKKRQKEKEQVKEEASSFYDELGELNRESRDRNREQKEKLSRALLGDSSS